MTSIRELELESKVKDLEDKLLLLSEVANASRMGVWEVLLDGDCIWDAEMYRHYGLSPENFTPTMENWFHYIHPDDKESLWGRVLRAIKGEEDYIDVHFRICQDSGKTVYIEAYGNRIIGGNGRTIGMKGANIDITERVLAQESERQKILLQEQKKRSESEANLMAEVNLKLVLEVANRTKDLEHAKKEAVSANESKSTFLANMSHEIRTPLTAIIGYSESLRDVSMNAQDQQSSIDTIIRGSHHLLSLINDILDFSKIEANKLEVEVVPVDLFALIMDVQSYFSVNAHSKGLIFDINYHFPLPATIFTDPTRLKQILLNLCSNALKFTEKGSVIIDVIYDSENSMMKFTVSDTGVGLTENQLGKLFQAFSQADSSTTRNHGGTGLGLIISRQLAELMGGTVSVKSVYGLGSEFEVSISSGPLENSQWVQSLSETQLVPVGKNSNIIVPQLVGRILYAEDNVDNQQLIKLLLKPTGCKLVVVDNGQEAVDKILNEDFDLILMDIQMPILNGIDATKKIRQSGYNKPIIALTANVMKEDLSRYSKAGCDDCLSKPVDRLKFYQSLNSHLGIDKKSHKNITKCHDILLGDEIIKVTGRVLLAEDNIDNQRLISMQIKRTGAEVVLASNGEEAVEKAMTQSFDLILMDVQMPLMNGDEAVKLLRDTGYSKPIYVLTANNNKSDIDRYLSSGFCGYLSKPINTKQLFLTISKYLKVFEISSSKVDPQLVTTTESYNKLLDDPVMRTLVISFLEGLTPMIVSIETAKKEGDWNTLKDLAHQLKGSAGSFGYPDLTKRAGEFEESIKYDDQKNKRLFCEYVIGDIKNILKNNGEFDVASS